MSSFTFTDEELSLVECVEKGEVKAFLKELERPGSPPKDKVRAEAIVRIVVGAPVQFPQGELRPVKFTNKGLQLLGATITGNLDLRDISGLCGLAPPRLSFEGCWFEEKINLMRSHLGSLSLRKSRFSELNASDATIEGPVDLAEICGIGQDSEEAQSKKSEDEALAKFGQCWVVLASARIAGRINARKSQLVAPPARKDKYVYLSKHAIYALDLRAAHIQSSVVLRPDFAAVGGVCLTLATVDGSIWANGARLVAVEEDAFVADYADIRGSVYLRCYDYREKSDDGEAENPKGGSVQFITTGGVSLFAARLGGSLYMQGALLKKAPRKVPEGKEIDDDLTVLNACNAEIGGDCYFSCWQSMAPGSDMHRFYSEGEIWMDSAKIKNGLSFSGGFFQRIIANNIDVGGNCSFSVRHEGTPRVTHRFECEGLEICGASIKGNLDMSGALLRSRKKPANLSAAGISVGGNCLLGAYKRQYETADGKPFARGLRFECYGNIVLAESRITNSLRMDGALLRAPRSSSVSALNLAGTTIGGESQLMTWNDHEARTSLPFTAKGGIVVLRLTGVKIAQKLILNGARIRARPTHASKSKAAAGQSVYAINAANAEIGGKASLSTFAGKCRGKDADYRFTAEGEINFTAATITLGLDLGGANLAAGGGYERKLLALDLSRAHLNFVWFNRDGLEGKSGNPFEASGRLKLEHTKIDADLDLRDASFNDPLIADHIKVGTSVRLEGTTISRRSIDSVIKTKPFSGEGTSPLQETVRKAKAKEIVNAHVERQLVPDLSFNGGEIGNALIVYNLKVQEMAKGEEHYGYSDLSHSTVDLRALRVGQLEDDGGLGWSRQIRLWLDGFRYQRLPEVPLSRKPETLGIIFEIAFKRLWNPSALPKERAREVNGRPIYEAPEQSAQSLKKPRREQDHISEPLFWIYNQIRSGGAWERRLRWLSLQYFNPYEPKKKEYSPDAYEQLVSGLNSIGSYDDARRISSARLTLESRLLYPWLLKPLTIPFRILFDYGFSAGRAVFTFALCIVLGFLAVKTANTRHVLVVNMGAPETGISLVKGEDNPEIESIVVENGVVENSMWTYRKPIPCDQRIHPLLYALDVFVPVLDLHQQTVCSVDPEMTPWRYAQAGYAILGWVLTPLTILTISGILRRHLEK